LIVLVVASLIAAGIAFFLIKARYQYTRLPELAVASGTKISDADLDDITVVIPARNEERNITGAVGSFRGVRVIVVDDDSSDRTAELARKAGAEVIQAPPLKKGIVGKPNACAAGAKACTTHWILFVDADTQFAREFLPSLMAEARGNSLDLLTVFLKQECYTMSERIILPYASALHFCGVNAKNVNSKKSYDALANSQCLLFRREVYEFLGGHNAVATSIIEDAMLAHIGKRHRINLKVMRAEHLGSARMYEGMQAIWRGFEKDSYRFLLINRWCGLQVLTASLLLTAYLPVIAVLAWLQYFVLAALFAILPPLLLRPWYDSFLRALWTPLAIYIFDVVALMAMVGSALGRGTLWKGRRA
jgi:glycosyltransferase involved in cell wall biosynthesis